MSGLSGFWTVYLKNSQKPRKIWTVLSGLSKKNRSKTAQDLNGFWAVYLKKTLKNRARFERFLSGLSKKKNAQKPLKSCAVFVRFFLDKPFKNRSNRSFRS